MFKIPTQVTVLYVTFPGVARFPPPFWGLTMIGAKYSVVAEILNTERSYKREGSAPLKRSVGTNLIL